MGEEVSIGFAAGVQVLLVDEECSILVVYHNGINALQFTFIKFELRYTKFF